MFGNSCKWYGSSDIALKTDAPCHNRSCAQNSHCSLAQKMTKFAVLMSPDELGIKNNNQPLLVIWVTHSSDIVQNKIQRSHVIVTGMWNTYPTLSPTPTQKHTPTFCRSNAFLTSFEQGTRGIFIVPHLQWHGTSVFAVSSEGPPPV